MAYARPLGQTFNQLNLNMYRLPDGQRGALRSTSLALAREASREDSQRLGSDGSSHFNPFKGIKRLYSGLRRHHSRSSDEGTTLRKFYSTPLDGRGSNISRPSLSGGTLIQTNKTTQTGAMRCGSDWNSDTAVVLADEASRLSPSNSPTRPPKRVRFLNSDPEVVNTYSPEEYDRRVDDPWELLTKSGRDKMRQEMHHYTSKEMELNEVYNTNDAQYCTLCWRQHCHCRAIAKDIWRRDRSASMVHAGA
ncbi:hypothetical protein LPJ66_000227 [Kickxella alabastrina]|uniref:Uncharacterized protein n=1 Tax=Kickxella alabastrina TaxID=61397 RepID=A0ACC1IWQ3_9FUNG|nr:hypothetical protein LPJ66_000227 [Kickxella alabastrina]